MKRIFPTIRKMTWEETSSHKLQNPGLILEYCDLMIPLSAGSSDSIKIFRESNSLLILITNDHHEYIGLDEVDCLDGAVIGSVFLQDHQIKETVGIRWLQMKPETLLKRLSNYL